MKWCELHSLAAWMRLIAVTGHDGGALQGEARAAGVERVFLKPVDVEELLRAVEGREPAHASVSR